MHSSIFFRPEQNQDEADADNQDSDHPNVPPKTAEAFYREFNLLVPAQSPRCQNCGYGLSDLAATCPACGALGYCQN